MVEVVLPNLACNINHHSANLAVMSTALKTMKLVNALVNGLHSDLRNEIKAPQKFNSMVVRRDAF